MKPHYITSRAEMRRILEQVKEGSLSVDDAYASISLTINEAHLSLAQWMEKHAATIREQSKP